MLVTAIETTASARGRRWSKAICELGRGGLEYWAINNLEMRGDELWDYAGMVWKVEEYHRH